MITGKMKNVHFLNLQAALSESRVEFETAVRTALIDGLANLTPAQIRNAFFPELTGAEFPVAIDSSQVG
jgi:hypothetical protein